jgi:hypothetical protein
MPRVAVDYSKTVIYRISHKEIAGLDYVGSTVNFLCRKGAHRSVCANTNSKFHHLKVYQTIRDNGGWDCFQMLEIKKFPCTDKREAEAEEERCRQELKAVLNTNRAFRTEDERKEHMKMNYEKNKEQIAEYQKEYHGKNKIRIAEHNKEYYQQNKNKIDEQRQVYIQKNKAKIAEQTKKYREQNKEKIKKTQTKTYICECCKLSLLILSKARHERSKKHQSFLL